MKKCILSILLLITCIVPLSAKDSKTYLIHCENFPYDFLVISSDETRIYYLNKAISGMQTLSASLPADYAATLHLQAINQTLSINPDQYHFEDASSIQQYFLALASKLNPMMLFSLDDYVTHDFSIGDLPQLYQMVKEKPEIAHYAYPALVYNGHQYLLSEEAVSFH